MKIVILDLHLNLTLNILNNWVCHRSIYIFSQKVSEMGNGTRLACNLKNKKNRCYMV